VSSFLDPNEEGLTRLILPAPSSFLILCYLLLRHKEVVTIALVYVTIKYSATMYRKN